MAAAEGTEIFEEVATETEAIVTELAEGMEVESAATEVSENTIDVSAQVNDALDTVNQQSLTNIVEESPEVDQAIQTDVSATVDSLTESLEESGVVAEDLPIEAGARFSLTDALARAGRFIVQKLRGLWQRLMRVGGILKKFAEFYILIDFIGRKITEIVDTINDATENPPWKGSITEEQKKQLELLQDAVGTMKPMYEGLEKAIKPLQENVISYGTIMVKLGGKEEEVEVLDVVAHIIVDGELQMQQAQETMKDGTDGLTVLSLTQISNNIRQQLAPAQENVFNVFANTQALVDLRDNKNNLVKNDQLKLYKFPSEDIDKTTNAVLSGDFPEWKEKVKSQGYSLAVMGASISTGAFVKSQVIMKVNEYLRKEVYPVIKKAARDAGTQAAKDYVSSKKADIIAVALIPVVGTEKAKALGEKVKNEAIKKAKAAAQAAGERKATVLQRSMESNIKPIVDEVMKANKDQMGLIAKYAAQQMMDIVVPPGKRSDIRARVTLPAGVSDADIRARVALPAGATHAGIQLARK